MALHTCLRETSAKPVSLSEKEFEDRQFEELLREDWEFLSDDGEGQILEDNDNGWTEDLNAEVVETLRKSRCLQVLVKHSAALHHLCDPNVELDENENIGEKGLEEEARMMASQLAESESQLCAEVLDSAFDPDCKEGGSKRVKHRSDNETTLSRRDMLIQLEKLKLEILQGSESCESDLEKQGFGELRNLIEQINRLERQILIGQASSFCLDGGMTISSSDEWVEVKECSDLKYQFHRLRQQYYHTSCKISKLYEPVSPAVSGIQVLFLIYRHRFAIAAAAWWIARTFFFFVL